MQRKRGMPPYDAACNPMMQRVGCVAGVTQHTLHMCGALRGMTQHTFHMAEGVFAVLASCAHATSLDHAPLGVQGIQQRLFGAFVFEVTLFMNLQKSTALGCHKKTE